jgi:hypothetical protein
VRIPFWLALAAFFAMVAVLAQRGRERLPDPEHPDGWAMTDFRSTIYYPAVAFLAGDDPYDPSFAHEYPVPRALPPYGPLMFVLHLPLALLPLRAAEAAYFMITLGLTLAVAALSLRGASLPRTPTAVLVVGTLILMSRPGHHNLLLGQCTLEVVLGAYLALVFGQQRPVLAALGIMLTSMKPQFIAPLSLLLLVAGERRIVAGGVALAGAVSLATLLAHGGTGLESWLRALATSSAAAAQPSTMWYVRIDLAHIARQALGGPEDAWTDLTTLALVLALGAVVLRRVPARPLAASVLGVTTACLAVLVSMYHTDYDALLLTLPITALAAGAGARTLPPRWRIALLVLLLVPAFNYLATDTVMRAFALDGAAWVALTALNGAALLAALLLCVAASLRAPAATVNAR